MVLGDIQEYSDNRDLPVSFNIMMYYGYRYEF